MPFLHITTRIEGREHDDLLMDKGGAGFPYLALLDSKGDPVAKIYPPLDLKTFKEVADRLRRRMPLDKKGAEGDRTAKIEAAILRCDLGEIDYGELEEILEPLGELSRKQAAMLKRLESNEDIADLSAAHRRSRDKNMQESLVEDAYLLYREGGYPTRSDLKLWLWPKLAVRALNNEDPDLLEMAIKELEPLAREENRLPEILRHFRVKLVHLKKKRKG